VDDDVAPDERADVVAPSDVAARLAHDDIDNIAATPMTLAVCDEKAASARVRVWTIAAILFVLSSQRRALPGGSCGDPPNDRIKTKCRH
jgi:hypothetical protein